MKINKKNQTKLAAKEKNDKIKIVNRISSPSFKSPLPNELKHWKSEKQLSFLKQESVKSLKTESFLVQKQNGKTSFQVFNQERKKGNQNDKTYFKKNDKFSSSQKISTKIPSKKDIQEKDKTKKNNNIKVEQLIREQELVKANQECQKLEKEVKELRRQNEKYREEVLNLENDKKELNKKVEKQNKTISENKKILKDKVSSYNRESEHIKELKDKILFLEVQSQSQIKSKRNSQITEKSLQIGINTITHQYLEFGSQTQIQEPYSSKSLPQGNFSRKMIEKIKQVYEKRIQEMNGTILQQQQFIISLQKQLNERYINESICNYSYICQSNISENGYEKKILQQLQIISKLQEVISDQNNKIESIKLQNKSLELSINGLRSDMQIEKVKTNELQLYEFRKSEQESHLEQSFMIKSKIDELQKIVDQKSEEIQMLQSKIFMQESMIKRSTIKKCIIKK